MSYIGATGLDENQEQFDILKDEIDANASYINNLVGIPDPLHTAVFGINVLNPGLFGLVERAEVKIKLLETAEEGLGTDVTGLQTEVNGLQTEVNGIQTEVNGIQTEITGIQGQVLGIEGDISTLNGAVFLEGGAIALVEIQAADALTKANRALDIWDYSGDNVYHKKAGNVGIGNTFGSTLTNKLEVQGNINIPTGSTFRINNEPFNYSHLAGEQPVSSKWTNATDTTTNIYYNTGNVGIGITTAINNKLEVAGNLNISTGSKYKINNVDLAFSDLGGTLSYNSLTNQLSGGTNIQILNGVINNTYELPKATTAVIGGVRPDGSTITINTSTGVISASAGAAQVNSDWTQTNTSLKSFIQNKPTAGTNISLANNTITNIITGSPTQNIITLNDNYLIVKDKPDSQIVTQVDVPLTSVNEPTITSPTFTESIRTFTHSGGTEDQTPHTITIGQNTICDILVLGGGGGGGIDRAGGGGAGALILSIGNILSAGTYTIRVGNKGLGSTTQFVASTNGLDSEIVNSSGNVIFRAKGGGAGGNIGYIGLNGGSGGGTGSSFLGLGGSIVSTNIVNGITSGPVITTTYGVYGNIGGRNNVGATGIDALDGAGGGGIGQGGSSSGSLVEVDTQFVANNGGKGGDGLYFATINGIVYNFKNYFNVDGIQDGTTGNFFIGGGGGGGDQNAGIAGIGGKGGGGKGGELDETGVSASGFGSGGGGGGGRSGGSQKIGGNGSAGIVAIRFKTIVNSAITEGNPITHKTLNFTYEPKYPTISVDNTNLKAWYKFDGNYNDSSGSGFNLTNSGAVIVDGLIQNSVSFPNSASSLSTSGINLNSKTYSICFWAKLNTTHANSGSERWYWSQSISGGVGTFVGFQYQLGGDKLRFTHYGSGNDMDTPAGMSALIGLNWNHYVITYNDTTKGGEIWLNSVKLATSPATMSTRFTGSGDFKIGTSILNNINFNGLMEDFRYYDKVLTSTEISQLYNIPTQNTYTLTVQPGTSIQVNNQTAQYLSGNYTISVGATQSSVLISGFSPANQTDPYPLQNGSTIAIRYSMLQRITSLVNYKKDGLIKYVPASGTNPSTGTWNIIDIDTQPLTQFSGNLPANRLDNIDMSKVATGNLDWSRIASQPALSALSGNLPLNRTDGNLPASRLDNIDMSKVATGNLHHSRVQDLYLGINNRFWRIEYAYENVITFGGIYINKFRINTNLHLNSYNEVYNYFQYFLSMSPNNLADRHMYWFGVVKMSNKVGTDSSPLTRSTSILSSDSSLWEIKETNSSSGVWWLNVWVYTTTFCESIICILH